MIMYPITEYSLGYTDSETGKTIYSSVNESHASNVASIVVPDMEHSGQK